MDIYWNRCTSDGSGSFAVSWFNLVITAGKLNSGVEQTYDFETIGYTPPNQAAQASSGIVNAWITLMGIIAAIIMLYFLGLIIKVLQGAADVKQVLVAILGTIVLFALSVIGSIVIYYVSIIGA
jgi:predicted membrane channel-forming protein YqfA (hemolysin III family)